MKVIVPATLHVSSLFRAINDMFRGLASKQLEKEVRFLLLTFFFARMLK